MARVLPSSLTPHICIIPSQDLEELLQSSALPSLHHILQSFSPLPQVTTRTTTLTTVPHASFALRFSDLKEIEAACREDEELRATRTIDWIGDRISKRCAKWVDDFEKMDDRDVARTPWWDELRRCAEGDHIPARDEGWNHPMSIILAVSTTAPNPLQAITALHSRTLDFPPWVDVTHLIYTLIIHPKNSPLSDEEAGALFNAVKKQYGLHTYLLSLELPSPPPPPVSIPALVPRLPPLTISNGPADAVPPDLKAAAQTILLNTLRMCEQDIQQTARFAREFVTMNLVPWMEKCVIEWNETYSSSRRLPLRLFSSTRRLFGTSSVTPVHSSTPSLPARSSTYTAPQSSVSGFTVPPPSQQRRLAEFATILGDFKLAVAVWESLRKEGKGGSDILPLLIAPSPAVQLHVSHALNTIHPQSAELHSHAQLRALLYAVRWESTLTIGDFLSDTLEGERWLVWAAGNAEEPPAALLLAHAALLGVRKNTKRRAALWYFLAANRLEKCGIKPLTIYFLRRAHELSISRPDKLLSPSFWISENKQPSDFEGFDAVMSGIEHPLGRLLYTTGDVAGAVRHLLGLLRWSSASSSPLARLSSHTMDITKDPSDSDKVFLEDFQVAISHLKSISGEQARLEDVKLPLRFVVPSQTCVRLARDSVEGEQCEWETREEIWSSFWRHRGKEKLERSGNAAVEEPFRVDITLRNPLDTEVTLANPTVIVESSSGDAAWIRDNITIETAEDTILYANESRTISIAVKASKPASLVITGVAYDFLGLLPTVESLARRGRRLQDTPQQRQTITYAPDEFLKLNVEEASQELAVTFMDDGPLVLVEGECKRMKLWMSNTGSRDIGEVWVVPGPEDEIWIGPLDSEEGSATSMSWKTWQSDNKIVQPTPYSIPLAEKLVVAGSTEVTVVLHAGRKRKQDLSLLFIYREAQGSPFHCTRVTRSYEVVQCLQISTASHPSPSPDHSFSLRLDLTNILSSSVVEIDQVTTISASWSCFPLAKAWPEPLRPSQSARISFGATSAGDCTSVNAVSAFVSRKLCNVLYGQTIAPDDPPPVELLCGHASQTFTYEPFVAHFIMNARRIAVSRSLAQSHPRIPTSSHPSIFPLYNPLSVDFVVFWKIPSEQRSGHMFVSEITLGASHAALREVLEGVESAKVKRSMYAETQREKVEMLQAIRDSEWNAEMNPVVVIVKDGLVIEHDFSQGVCMAPVEFTIRNHSLSHPSRFVLRLDHRQQPSLHHFPAPYCGRTTFRGLLGPLQTTSVVAQLFATRPGTYALSGWRLETEVGEPNMEGGSWQVRHRYEQRATTDDSSSVVVSDISRP